jgi:DNA polymerase-1
MSFQPDVEKTDALFNELEFRRMAEQFDSIFKRYFWSRYKNIDDSKLYKNHSESFRD